MKRIIATGFMVVLVLGMLAGCTQPAPSPTQAPAQTEAPVATEAATIAPTEAPTVTPITVTDALDRVVSFDTLPSRIVIAGKAGFMITDAVYLFPEARERVAAYVTGTQTPNDFFGSIYPDLISPLKVETTSGPEQIAPIQPDVVLLKAYLKESLGDPLEQLGIKVVYLNLETPEEINRDIRILGTLFGNSARAEDIVQLLDTAAKKVTDVTANLKDEEKYSVLMLQYSDKGGEIAFKVPPLDWLQTSLVTMAGGTPAWKDVPTEGWTVITFEQIAAWNPQVIMLIDYKGNAMEVVTNLKADQKWMLLDAVKNGKLYAFPVDFQSWDQPDTRWTLGLTWVAAKLHPDMFANVKMLDEVQTFYSNFYGLDADTITNKILPLIKGDL